MRQRHQIGAGQVLRLRVFGDTMRAAVGSPAQLGQPDRLGTIAQHQLVEPAHLGREGLLVVAAPGCALGWVEPVGMDRQHVEVVPRAELAQLVEVVEVVIGGGRGRVAPDAGQAAQHDHRLRVGGLHGGAGHIQDARVVGDRVEAV